MSTFVKATGAAIRAARLARKPKKLTQVELAERLSELGPGWTQRKVSLIESGKQPPHVGEVEQIARVLQCDLKALLMDAVERMRSGISA